MVALAILPATAGCGFSGADAATGEPAGRPAALPATESPDATMSSPPPTKGPRSGTGEFRYAAGTGPVTGDGDTLMRYRVGAEYPAADSEPVVDVDEVAEFVEETFADQRGWTAGGRWRFQRTDSGPYDFTIYVATPQTTDNLCAPLRTGGEVSCRQGARVALNLHRWQVGVPHYDADLTTYRRYLINHEVGHRLGNGHEVCPGRGRLAPLMQQQTLKLAGCRANPWPYPDDEAYHGPPGGYDG